MNVVSWEGEQEVIKYSNSDHLSSKESFTPRGKEILKLP